MKSSATSRTAWSRSYDLASDPKEKRNSASPPPVPPTSTRRLRLRARLDGKGHQLRLRSRGERPIRYAVHVTSEPPIPLIAVDRLTLERHRSHRFQAARERVRRQRYARARRRRPSAFRRAWPRPACSKSPSRSPARRLRRNGTPRGAAKTSRRRRRPHRPDARGRADRRRAPHAQRRGSDHHRRALARLVPTPAWTSPRSHSTTPPANACASSGTSSDLARRERRGRMLGPCWRARCLLARARMVGVPTARARALTRASPPASAG